MWNSAKVFDLSTLQPTGTFPIGTWSSALSSRTTGFAAQPGNSETINSAWLQTAPGAAPTAAWQPQYSLTIADPGLTAISAAQSPWKMVSTGGDRVAMPVHWSGKVLLDSNPGRLYLLNRH
jgi:hypothetical protein